MNINPRIFDEILVCLKLRLIINTIKILSTKMDSLHWHVSASWISWRMEMDCVWISGGIQRHLGGSWRPRTCCISIDLPALHSNMCGCFLSFCIRTLRASWWYHNRKLEIATQIKSYREYFIVYFAYYECWICYILRSTRSVQFTLLNSARVLCAGVCVVAWTETISHWQFIIRVTYLAM